MPQSSVLTASSSSQYCSINTWLSMSPRGKRRRRIPIQRPRTGAAAFSADGSLIALFQWPGLINLLDRRSLEPLAILESPDPRQVNCIAFDPTGRTLAVAAGKRIELWDLGKLRQNLSQVGLDWGQPETQSFEERPMSQPPTTLTVNATGLEQYRQMNQMRQRANRIIRSLGFRDAATQLLHLLDRSDE